MRRTRAGNAVVTLHYSADPGMTPERVKELRSKYTSESWWRKEMEIDYDALEGARVYPSFDTAIHVIPHERIPRRLCRYCAIDPHPRTPHAVLWLGIDAWHDMYVYREYWPSKLWAEEGRAKDQDLDTEGTIQMYAEAIAALEGNSIRWHHPETEHMYGVYVQSKDGENIVDRYMDQAGKSFRASGENNSFVSYAARYREFGLPCRDPDKRHAPGEDTIRDLLRPRRHDVYGAWPRLHVSEFCRELILEFLNHRYKTSRVSDERELKQEAAEARSHMLDCLRYLVTARLDYSASMESPEGFVWRGKRRINSA